MSCVTLYGWQIWTREKGLQVELVTTQCNFSLESRFKLLSLQEFYKSLDKARFLMLRSQAKRMMSVLLNLLDGKDGAVFFE